jgi:hypothetical protein
MTIYRYGRQTDKVPQNRTHLQGYFLRMTDRQIAAKIELHPYATLIVLADESAAISSIERANKKSMMIYRYGRQTKFLRTGCICKVSQNCHTPRKHVGGRERFSGEGR